MWNFVCQKFGKTWLILPGTILSIRAINQTSGDYYPLIRLLEFEDSV